MMTTTMGIRRGTPCPPEPAKRPANLPTSPPPPRVDWWNPPPVQPQINSHLDDHKRNLQGLMSWLRMEERISEASGREANRSGDIEMEQYFAGRQEMAFRAQVWIEQYTRGIA